MAVIRVAMGRIQEGTMLYPDPNPFCNGSIQPEQNRWIQNRLQLHLHGFDSEFTLTRERERDRSSQSQLLFSLTVGSRISIICENQRADHPHPIVQSSKRKTWNSAESDLTQLNWQWQGWRLLAQLYSASSKVLNTDFVSLCLLCRWADG